MGDPLECVARLDGVQARGRRCCLLLRALGCRPWHANGRRLLLRDSWRTRHERRGGQAGAPALAALATALRAALAMAMAFGRAWASEMQLQLGERSESQPESGR